MKRWRLAVTIEARELAPVLQHVARWPWFASAKATRMGVNDQPAEVVDDWPAALVAAQEGGYVEFGPRKPRSRMHMVSLSPGRNVVAVAPEVFERPEQVVDLLASVPFELATLGDVYPDEWDAAEDRSRIGFANQHGPLGFGCAFRAGGHDRLVSRRWLDFGPWRVLRGPGDLSVVQFHDLAADANAALAQATPGHERMGISEIGGFIQGPSAAGKGIKYSPWESFPEGLYDATARSLEVVVAPGREVSQGEMLDACAYRRLMRADKTRPIERIAYVFMTESAARAHLHELWLRELEVWTVEGGAKRRLDLDYAPEPKKPDWVLDMERRR